MKGFRRNMVNHHGMAGGKQKAPKSPNKCRISRCNSNSGEDMRCPFVLPMEDEKKSGYQIKGQGLDFHLEGEAAAALLAAEGVAAGLGEASTAAAVHHVEQDVGVDVDVAGAAAHAAHTSHATHSAHTSHTAHAAEAATATAEHVVRINKVITVIISGTFPVKLLI
jgi:hypothetical protein